jgi:hypothetical protein
MATPQDNYLVPGRASFMGQVGNIGSNNGLAGASNNASVGGTANNGVQSSNAATVAAFAVVKTKTSPAGMGGGSGGSEAPVAQTASFPAQAQQAVGIAKFNEEPAQFTAAGASPASLGNNVNFPSTNGKSVVLPANDGFNKAANTVTISNTGAKNKAGITNTLFNAGENDLTLAADNQNVAADAIPAKNKATKASPLNVPLYTPANEPGGNGPNYANASKLAGDRSNSSLLPNSNG